MTLDRIAELLKHLNIYIDTEQGVLTIKANNLLYMPRKKELFNLYLHLTQLKESELKK